MQTVWNLHKFVKLLQSKSKSMCQIVDNTPVLLFKIQTQTVWNLHKFVKLLKIESKSCFQFIDNTPVFICSKHKSNIIEMYEMFVYVFIVKPFNLPGCSIRFFGKK